MPMGNDDDTRFSNDSGGPTFGDAGSGSTFGSTDEFQEDGDPRNAPDVEDLAEGLEEELTAAVAGIPGVGADLSFMVPTWLPGQQAISGGSFSPALIGIGDTISKIP